VTIRSNSITQSMFSTDISTQLPSLIRVRRPDQSGLHAFEEFGVERIISHGTAEDGQRFVRFTGIVTSGMLLHGSLLMRHRDTLSK
jgi:hypothetical protein